ncbi:hypothetical protein IAD21_01105 [Abditibacteriota bacterium]|nr:hypothetical protein IAD21_01105 [Abditibacteriota bacterium]
MFHLSPHKSSRRAFTLIELLVVIAIIAILAAILFPVFARARENARRSSCQSNVKQIGLGVLQYAQDYDEKYPLAHTPSWYVTIQPYLKSEQIYKCPSDSDNTSASGVAYKVSYAGCYDALGDSNQPRTLASFDSPASMVMVTDGGKQADATTGTVSLNSPDKNGGLRVLIDVHHGGGTFDAAATTDGNWMGPSPRHLETVTVGFVDGHVKSLKPEKFYYLNSPMMYRNNKGY